MTVKELIEELKKMDQDKIVKVSTLNHYFGEVMRVHDCDDFIDLETDDCV